MDTPEMAIKKLMKKVSVAQFTWSPTLVCPRCRSVPVEPVTGRCGHTWCGDCAWDANVEPASCACGAQPPERRGTDVLVRSLTETLFPNQRLAAEKYRLAAYCAKRDSASAKNICMEAILIDPRNVQLRLLSAKIHWRAGELALAKEQLNTLMKIDPRLSEAHYVMGHVLKDQHQYEDSMKSFLVSWLLGQSKEDVQRPMIEFYNKMMSKHRKNRPRFLNKVRCYVKAKIKRFNNFRREAVSVPSEVEVCELECTVCSLCYLRPVATPCGHTFCRHCVERCLDHELGCPLCNASIKRMRRSNEVHDTVFVKAITLSVPCELRVRTIEKPDMLPLMICTTGFPSVSCPLLIKEGRYRLMVRRALASGGRQFGMVSCGPSPRGAGQMLRHSEFGTLLEIKDCVTCEDGSLILSTVGLTRFRVNEVEEVDGYDVARVETMRDRAVDRYDEELMRLQATVLEKASDWVRNMYHGTRDDIEHSFGRMPPHDLHWDEDGPNWVWWLMAAMPLTIQLKRMLLCSTELVLRLRVIDKTLDLRKWSMREELRQYEDPQRIDEEIDNPISEQLEEWLIRPVSLTGHAEFDL